eukprot:7622487-Prorocentrum_lima.AAC.1
MRAISHAIVRLDTALTQHMSNLSPVPNPGVSASTCIMGRTPPSRPVPPLPAHLSQTQGNHAP